MTVRRRFGLILLTLLIVAALGYGFRPQPLWVEAATVTRQPLRVTVEAEGKTRLIDRYVLSAPVAGYLHRIDWKIGDGIRQGQPLAMIDSLPSEVLDPRRRAQAEARVATSEASLQAARETATATRAEADYAKLEFERIAALCKQRCVVTEAERDRAQSRARQTEAQLRSAQFAVEVARHEVEAAKTALRHSAAQPGGAARETVIVRAPVDGQVLARPRQSEGVVEMGTPLLEVGDPRALEIAVDLLSADAVRVRPGTPVVLERWGGEQPLEGVTRTVEPVGFTKLSALGVEEQRVWVIADLRSPAEAWSRLGDGYRVEASFVVWQGDRVPQIPASALFRQGEGWAVFVIENGQARRRPVEIGQRGGLRVEIRSGLTEGEQVVTHPNDALREGAAVRIRAED
ncbi:MAG: efflux RND transporter periplasmic adaptor subunit [Candidatus Contendobacter sp.]|nr:efflux RND transporter periplasmic adaptor subunit [Candidatus Contendobacter sp.]MDG4557445.1 efflux RND transporter periplasmic adaptor subunit [Candidatus Contendobacter sp.]